MESNINLQTIGTAAVSLEQVNFAQMVSNTLQEFFHQIIKVSGGKIEQGVLQGDEDVSRFLGGVSKKILIKYRKHGLPYHQIDGIYYYLPEEVMEWVRMYGCRIDSEQKVEDEKMPIVPKSTNIQPKVKTAKPPQNRMRLKVQFKKSGK